jgi:hypothetical protein
VRGKKKEKEEKEKIIWQLFGETSSRHQITGST